MPNRDQMRGPMSLEEYSALIGQDLSQRPFGHVHGLFDFMNSAASPIDGGKTLSGIFKHGGRVGLAETLLKNGLTAAGDISNGGNPGRTLAGAGGKATGGILGAVRGGRIGAGAVAPVAARFPVLVPCHFRRGRCNGFSSWCCWRGSGTGRDQQRGVGGRHGKTRQRLFDPL